MFKKEIFYFLLENEDTISPDARNVRQSLDGKVPHHEPDVKNESHHSVASRKAGLRVLRSELMPSKRKKPPMGLSIDMVRAKGKQPVCKFCRGKINRHAWCTVKRFNDPSTTVKWATIDRYHFSCSNNLTQDEKGQLVAIINASVEIVSEEKERLMDRIGDR